MCSGATQRNKAPYWVQSAWVNVCLLHKAEEMEVVAVVVVVVAEGGCEGRGD